MINDVIKTLIDKNISISFAESCTGGLLVSTLTKYPGVSKILSESYVTYSEEAKANVLGVKITTLMNYGVFSRECAEEMVIGLNKKTGARLCVSTTGIAGPDSVVGKPVGLVFIGFYLDGETFVYEENFTGTREHIQEQVKDFVFTIIDKMIS